MERPMRRVRQQLAEHEAKKILTEASNGILSLVDSDGYPYGVPLSFAYDGEYCIYFHSARSGHKIDCIAAEGRCSFCAVGQDQIVPEEFTSYFRSVIARGRIGIVTEPNELLRALHLLCRKYSPGINPEEEIAKCINRVAILRMDIATLTGKEAIELVRAKVSM